jgi:hypothetical protein
VGGTGGLNRLLVVESCFPGSNVTGLWSRQVHGRERGELGRLLHAGDQRGEAMYDMPCQYLGKGICLDG